MTTGPELSRRSGAEAPASAGQSEPTRFGGAVGVGLVLVLLPSIGLYLGIGQFDRHPNSGLSIVALFGIVVLVGALALTSTLYARLYLANRKQPLALPPGSVRATMALALIVIFAIISASVLHPHRRQIELKGLTAEARNDVVRDGKLQVLAVMAEPCAPTAPVSAPNILAVPGWPQGASCAAADQRYTVTVLAGPSPADQDLAKQLLTLIGTLMTSVVSYYFAARSAKDSSKPSPSGTEEGTSRQPQDSGTPGNAAVHDEHADGCCTAIDNPTADHELPAAKGGVATS